MKLLYFFEGLRAPWLDRIMLLITELGGEIFFMALAIALFWCYSKRMGYYVLTVGFTGTLLNQFLKLACRVSRPWVKDPSFTIVEGARAAATGYSFPSGHTQNAAASLGCMACETKRKTLRAVLWVLYALVAVSRLYLGVHTPWDVGVSLVLGLALMFALRPLFRDIEQQPKRMYALLGGMAGLALLYLLYTQLFRFPADIEVENLNSGIKNAYTLLGAVMGMIAAYWLDQRYIHFSVRGSAGAQIVKCVLGLALTVMLRAVLKAPLNALFQGAPAAHAVRYFLVVLFAAGVWPMTFPWICKKLPD